MKKKIVVFTGAGISKESGISTFRDADDGLWNDHKIEEVATKTGWLKNQQLVMDFHNKIRTELVDKKPNIAHTLIKDLEEKYDVTIVTQNIDNLHEKAGSSLVYHLHGELLKSRCVSNDNVLYDCTGDLNVGDLSPNGEQLRPHTVFFEEMPYFVQESYDALVEADILIVVGTSLEIGYTIQLLGATMAKEIYYIDPKPSLVLESQLGIFNKPLVKYIKKKATVGMTTLFKKLNKKEKNNIIEF